MLSPRNAVAALLVVVYLQHGLGLLPMQRVLLQRQRQPQLLARQSAPSIENTMGAKNIAKKVSSSILAALLTMNPAGAFASDGKVLNEVWTIVNDNFVDSTYNHNDWAKVKKDYTQRIVAGANEQELTKKMLSLLDDKYTRLLDKEYFESLWKYDAIGVGLLLQSGDKVGDKMVRIHTYSSYGIRANHYLFLE
jgi:Tricorn protease C1 domain